MVLWRVLGLNPVSVRVIHTLAHVHILCLHTRAAAAQTVFTRRTLSHVSLLACLVRTLRLHAPCMPPPFYSSSPPSLTHSSSSRTLEKERRKVIEDKDDGVEQDEEKHHACLAGARAPGVTGR